MSPVTREGHAGVIREERARVPSIGPGTPGLALARRCPGACAEAEWPALPRPRDGWACVTTCYNGGAVSPEMRRIWWLAPAALALWLATGPPAAAASFTLSEAERQEALRFGRRSVASEEFGGEWKVRDGAGQSGTVMTPFHRLALAARNAAFKKETLRPRDINSVLKESSGKLTFWVTLRGARADFARFYVPVLLDGRSEIRASFVQNERTALREEDGRYAARCLYVFPAERLSGKGRLTLVVRDPDDKERARFMVDLSAMR